MTAVDTAPRHRRAPCSRRRSRCRARLGAASRVSGRGGGTTLPGRVLLRLAPDAIARLGARLEGDTTVVSATNGKTTTAAMIASILAAAGRRPVHNRAGSNMTWGVATALLEQGGREGLFEVDEAWLRRVAAQLRPVADRARQPLSRPARPLWGAGDACRRLGRLGGRACRRTRFALNADDPLVADLGRDADGKQRPGITYFGIDDPSQALPELQHAHDAKHCRRCGHAYAYERAFVGHLGHYACPNCGADRPVPSVTATKVELHGMRGSAVTIATPGRRDRRRAAVAGALQRLQRARRGGVRARAGGRAGRDPQRTGSDASRVRSRGDDRDRRQAGLDPADQEPRRRQRGAAHVAPREGRRRARPLAGAERPHRRRPRRLLDLGRRLRAAGRVGPAGRLRRDPGSGDGAAAQVRRLARVGDRGRAPGSRTRSTPPSRRRPGRLFALPTYTALLELRTLLADRGLARDYWA